MVVHRRRPVPVSWLLLPGTALSFFKTSRNTQMFGRKEGNVLFNDTLNTFYFTVIWRQTYGKGPLSEREDPLPPHGLLFPINSKGSFICTIPQTG